MYGQRSRGPKMGNGDVESGSRTQDQNSTEESYTVQSKDSSEKSPVPPKENRRPLKVLQDLPVSSRRE